jgi:hypothetical protein
MLLSAPRQGFHGSPKNELFVGTKTDQKASSIPSNNYKQLQATFSNTGNDPSMEKAQLFFKDQFWTNLGHGDSEARANTYDGHYWNVRVGGEIVKKWVISEKDGTPQSFQI